MAQLPVELVRAIFEQCATEYPEESRRSLLLVSRAVLDIVAPVVFATFTLDARAFEHVTTLANEYQGNLIFSRYVYGLYAPETYSGSGGQFLDVLGTAGLQQFGHVRAFMGCLTMLKAMMFHAHPFQPTHIYLTGSCNGATVAEFSGRLRGATHLLISGPAERSISRLEELKRLENIVYRTEDTYESAETTGMLIAGVRHVLQEARQLRQFTLLFDDGIWDKDWSADGPISASIRDTRTLFLALAAENPRFRVVEGGRKSQPNPRFWHEWDSLWTFA